MLYSKNQIFNKLNDLLQYSINNFNNSYNYSSTMSSEVQRVKNAIETYLNTDKNKIAQQFHELIKSYMWFKDAKYQKCENDDYLGISISDIPDLYWMQNWSLITTHGCFDFSTIMNTSNETFLSNWYFESSSGGLISYGSGGSSGGSTIGGGVLRNHLIGNSNNSGWVKSILDKRAIELQNIKDAIDYMENNYFEVDGILDIFEDRGDVIGAFPLIAKIEQPTYKVRIRSLEGDRIEERQGTGSVLSASTSIESIAAMIYCTEYYGLFWIILGLELYNINDFSENSKPVSTWGAGKVYIPSYLKNNFKNLLNI